MTIYLLTVFFTITINDCSWFFYTYWCSKDPVGIKNLVLVLKKIVQKIKNCEQKGGSIRDPSWRKGLTLEKIYWDCLWHSRNWIPFPSHFTFCPKESLSVTHLYIWAWVNIYFIAWGTTKFIFATVIGKSKGLLNSGRLRLKLSTPAYKLGIIYPLRSKATTAMN